MSDDKQSAKYCREKASINRIIASLNNWGTNNYRNFPWRQTSNDFHALIAELMLQRTKAEQVIPIYLEFVNNIPNLNTEFNIQNLSDLLFPLGLHWRSKKIIELINTLKQLGKIPDSYDELINLPGVGQYVASAFLSFHKNQRYPLIDSNTVRIWSRVFGIKTSSETRRKKWFIELSDTLTPKINFMEFNYALLDLAGSVCVSKPLCSLCPLMKECFYYQSISKNMTNQQI